MKNPLILASVFVVTLLVTLVVLGGGEKDEPPKPKPAPPSKVELASPPSTPSSEDLPLPDDALPLDPLQKREIKKDVRTFLVSYLPWVQGRGKLENVTSSFRRELRQDRPRPVGRFRKETVKRIRIGSNSNGLYTVGALITGKDTYLLTVTMVSRTRNNWLVAAVKPGE